MLLALFSKNGGGGGLNLINTKHTTTIRPIPQCYVLGSLLLAALIGKIADLCPWI